MKMEISEDNTNVVACYTSDKRAQLEKFREYITSGKYSERQIRIMMNLTPVSFLSLSYKLSKTCPGIEYKIRDDEQNMKPLVVSKNGGINLPAKLIENMCKENQFVAGATLSMEVDCDTIMIKVVGAPASEQDTNQQAVCLKKKSGKKLAVEAKPDNEDDKSKEVHSDSLNQELASKMAQIISSLDEEVIRKLKIVDSKTISSIVDTNIQSVEMTAQ